MSTHAFARATSAAAFLLLIAGGLVTSTGSALAVPDWPLSFGRFFPPMVGGILFEHGHRMIAGLVSLLTFALGALFYRDEKRAWARNVAYAACAAIILQAVLGGLTVLLRLPPQIAVSHACLAQAVFCLILTLAQITSPWYLHARPAAGADGLWRLGALSVAAVYLQLLWGAIVRHTGHGIALHAAWALAVTAAVGASAFRLLTSFSKEPVLSRPGALLAGLLPVQLALGVAAYLIRYSPYLDLSFNAAASLTTAHVAVGALILGTSVIWTLRAYRLQ